MKSKIFSLVVTALILISFNGIADAKEVEKAPVKNTQDKAITILRLPYQH
ncbi:hypothetical protein [Aneurinibacillus aneurinilyticus]|jgi:hypothetical protein|uniref:Uncharacterized protein n=2 Tax=Aneurinibacillus aneurinilyticus TaxID=1391 RepID=A0A848D0V3_ANEAE|nr:hypothetical protein [Aneurinibacillus aneurinilyticus]ERI11129.1 hypothetical protein HMPREF0083_00755 [Aneurinibacillus aneurinilyticus ATCC 12856]MCI1694998.1 hypothetical protein [Aneurinibacillus aneurinilyticus]MED0673462.1 hypothetical protein [Aneurinibacillus aneurinilyticus]MED0709275.1 hypothetical protein [Aneurinibacillus aneurinilyticus]MED0723548.1 hypothetical protein [Aneurinibacillus aneurinilyticus]